MGSVPIEQYKKWNQENKLLLLNATWHSTNSSVKTARKIGILFLASVLFLLVSCFIFKSYDYEVKYPLIIFGTITGIIFSYQCFWAIRYKTFSTGTNTFIGNHARDLAVIEIACIVIALGFLAYWNYITRGY